ncbi:16S rRNA (guanine(527)-N(7))-methyltransferase RsmG [Phyllobacterium phragmitis]|uniref:Ribosomal RNA small subunit methyltransferase G n=1 Tax=Phyllobacterium phragmitis TaxID=2670329 RepID=A0A2S9IV08_9HYPH|nr:16S rRNA (guanine(527)-N(7))-methyltransferase RsmG [Phyllobacterium phragmitis]PRD44372.1 16S rRNA (guanine(527)-N(7))-methyltransferase RsmG [Phyllobacterium phragmitis]
MREERFLQLRNLVPVVSRETFESLDAFESLFRKWSSAINLASPSTLSHLWERHILDSAQLFPLAPEARKWLDLGSGGGFPGVVLAILLKERADSSIDLVESNGKKAAFLRTAIAQTKASGRVHAQRIESMWSEIKAPDIITARALAPLNDLLSLSEPWLISGATALFQKGRDYRREIEESHDGWAFDLVEHPSAVGEESVILEIRNLRNTRRSGSNSAELPKAEQ